MSMDSESKEIQFRNATKVLKYLELKGLKEPAIASGWIRGFLNNTPPSDIDIAYVGDIHFDFAQQYLREAIEKYDLAHMDWDIEGIWNAQLDDPRITSTVMNYEIHYVCSIDSVYLASDGRLHDLFKSGIQDARDKVLRLNDFEAIAEKYGFAQPDRQIVYYATEGLRRIYRFGWHPTERSLELIAIGLDTWSGLNESDQSKTISRLKKKYNIEEYDSAQEVYEEYNWGFLFDRAKEESQV